MIFILAGGEKNTLPTQIFFKMRVIFTLFCLLPFALANYVGSKRICDFNNETIETETELVCSSRDSPFCFALWKYKNDSLNNTVIFVKQGCWATSPSTSCTSPCVATAPPKDGNYFCCCNTDNCNGNVTYEEIEEIPADEEFPEHNNIYLIVSMAILIFGCICVILTSYIFFVRKKDGKLEEFLAEEENQLMGKEDEKDFFISDHLNIGELLGKGKFGSVYLGELSGAEVAVKMFTADQREFFDNERFVYHLLSNHHHQNILQYKGWQEFTVTTVNMLLVLERVKPGNLREFLTTLNENNPLEIDKAAKIMKGVASGISFLHGDNKDDLVIAHRDLTSKNILLDGDLNAKISDFGLSLYANGSKYYWAGREKQAEFSSLAEAGTLRYMAPELLEGAVNLKDCENALKQADVYALALIIWEIANCSCDLSLNNESCHKLPYESEIGKDICMESLSRYVVSRRDRPSFASWRDSQVCRSLRDTLNESWDPEPDARLTALCIVERLADIHLCKKTADSVTPLEVGSSSPWTGRNACLQRNLLEENSEEKSMEYLVTSEKHLNNVIAQFNNMSSSNDSYASNNTTNTELSSYSQIQQQPIPFLHNIQR